MVETLAGNSSKERKFREAPDGSVMQRIWREKMRDRQGESLIKDVAEDMPALIRHADAWACSVGLAKRGDRIVIVGGSHLTAGPGSESLASGVHDIVVVHEVEGR